VVDLPFNVKSIFFIFQGSRDRSNSTLITQN
jgi:hypothetical protein